MKELDIQRDYIGLDQLGFQQQSLQNCSQGLQGVYGYYPPQSYVQYNYCSPPRALCDWEIVIEQISADRVSINYGAKLRLLMADPMKGHDLREAIHKLRVALKEVIQNAV